jgi:hypothetical protein
MLSRLVDYQRLVVRIRPLVSVPVNGDRHSVVARLWAPLGADRTLTFRSVVIGKRILIS